MSSTIKVNVLFQPQYSIYIYIHTYNRLCFSFFVLCFADTSRCPRPAARPPGAQARPAAAPTHRRANSFVGVPRVQGGSVVPCPGAATLTQLQLWRAWAAAGCHTWVYSSAGGSDVEVTVSYSEALMLYLIYCEGRVKIYFSIRNFPSVSGGWCTVLLQVLSLIILCSVAIFHVFYSLPESAGRQLRGDAFGLLSLRIIEEKIFVRTRCRRFIVFCK